MKKILGAAFLVLLLPDAHAGARDEADFCGVLQKYVDGASKGYKGLKGRKDDLGDYVVRTRLPGAEECVVFAAEEKGDSEFLSCEMGDLDATRAKARFDELVRQVRACLPEKEWAVEVSGGEEPTTIFRRKDDVIVEVADDVDGSEHSLAISVEDEQP